MEFGLDQLRIGLRPGSKLVADRSEASRRPASSCLDDRPNFSSLQVCDQLRTRLLADSVMEFGFYQLSALILTIDIADKALSWSGLSCGLGHQRRESSGD